MIMKIKNGMEEIFEKFFDIEKNYLIVGTTFASSLINKLQKGVIYANRILQFRCWNGDTI